MGHEKKIIKKESVGKCKMCGIEHFRDEVEDCDKWFYHESVGVVCRHHPGIKEWYDDLLRKSDEELEKEIGYKGVPNGRSKN